MQFNVHNVALKYTFFRNTGRTMEKGLLSWLLVPTGVTLTQIWTEKKNHLITVYQKLLLDYLRLDTFKFCL